MPDADNLTGLLGLLATVRASDLVNKEHHVSRLQLFL